jgi:hypothetical protein
MGNCCGPSKPPPKEIPEEELTPSRLLHKYLALDDKEKLDKILAMPNIDLEWRLTFEEKESYVDRRNLYENATPLMQAILQKNVAAVELLLSKNVDVNAAVTAPIPYNTASIPVIQTGATAIIVALYQVFDIVDTENPLKYMQNPNEPKPFKWNEICTICEKLLAHPKVDVSKGFKSALGGEESARTMAGFNLPNTAKFAGSEKSRIEGIARKIQSHPTHKAVNAIDAILGADPANGKI